MSFIGISKALDSHLSLMSRLPSVAWENSDFTPTVGELYLVAQNLQGDTYQDGIGISSQDITTGVYQIDINAPAEQGKFEAIEMADLIANQFKNGTIITLDSINVRIKRTSRGAATTENGFYTMPVFINYYAYTEAR